MLTSSVYGDTLTHCVPRECNGVCLCFVLEIVKMRRQCQQWKMIRVFVRIQHIGKITATHKTNNTVEKWMKQKSIAHKRMKKVSNKKKKQAEETRWRAKGNENVAKWTNRKCVRTLLLLSIVFHEKRKKTQLNFFPFCHINVRDAQFHRAHISKENRWQSKLRQLSSTNGIYHRAIEWALGAKLFLDLSNHFSFLVQRTIVEFPNGKIQFDLNLIFVKHPTRCGDIGDHGGNRRSLFIAINGLQIQCVCVCVRACLYCPHISCMRHQTYHSCQTGRFACVI